MGKHWPVCSCQSLLSAPPGLIENLSVTNEFPGLASSFVVNGSSEDKAYSKHPGLYGFIALACYEKPLALHIQYYLKSSSGT